MTKGLRHRKAAFVFLPRVILHAPPIRRRGEGSERGLSVFEFAIAAAVVSLARASLGAARHRYALKVGKEAIRELRRSFPDKELNRSKIGGTNYEFKVVGCAGYRQGQEQFRAGEATIEITARALLRTAGVSRNATYLAHLPAALKRLTQPVCGFPPVLKGWRAAGGLILHVHADWMPISRFARVPLPLPTHGPTVLALYLFAAASNPRGSIRTETLYRRLGIPLTYPAHAKRSLDKALALVNAHLGKLDHHWNAHLRKLDHHCGYMIEPIQDGERVRLLVIAQQQETEEDSADAKALRLKYEYERQREREERDRQNMAAVRERLRRSL